MRRAYFVIGGESTGTHALTEVLAKAGCYDAEFATPEDYGQLPDRVVVRRSNPHGGQWISVAEYVGALQAAGYQVTVLVTTREWNVTSQSQLMRRHVASIAQAYLQLMRCYRMVLSGLSEFDVGDVPYFMVTYEAMPNEGYRRWLCGLLELQYPVSFISSNQNAKYYS